MKTGAGSTERFFVHRLAAEQYIVAGFSQHGYSLLHVGEFPYPLPYKVDCYTGIKNGRLWSLAQTERGSWWQQKISQQNNQLYVEQTAITTFNSKKKLQEQSVQPTFENPSFMKLGDVLFFRQGDSYIAFHLTLKSMKRPHCLPPSWQNLHCSGFFFSHFDDETAKLINNLEKIHPQSIFIDLNNNAFTYFQNQKEIVKKIKPWKGFFHWKLFSFHYFRRKLIVEHPQWTGNVSIKLPENWNIAANTSQKTDHTLQLDFKNWPLAAGSSIEYISKTPLEKKYWLARIAQLQKKYSFLFQDKRTAKNYAALLRWLALLRPFFATLKPSKQQRFCAFFIPRRLLKSIQPLWLELAPTLQKSKYLQKKGEFYSTVTLTASGSVYGNLQDNIYDIREHRLWFRHWQQYSKISLHYWRIEQWLKFAWFSLFDRQNLWHKYEKKDAKTWIARAQPLGICLAALFLLFPLSLLDPPVQKKSSSQTAGSVLEEPLLAVASYTEEQTINTASQPEIVELKEQDSFTQVSAEKSLEEQPLNEESLTDLLTNDAESLFYNDLLKENGGKNNTRHPLLSQEEIPYQDIFTARETLAQKNNEEPQQKQTLSLEDTALVKHVQSEPNKTVSENYLQKLKDKENTAVSELFAKPETKTTNNALTPSFQKGLTDNTDELKKDDQSSQMFAVSQELPETESPKTTVEGTAKKEEKIIGILNIDTEETEQGNAQQKLDKLLGQTTSADQLLRILTERLEKEKQIQQQLENNS